MRQGATMSATYTTEYYYSDGRRQVKIAKFFFDGERITYSICPDCNNAHIPGFDANQADQYARKLINFPLLRSRLRSRTLPDVFPELTPNSRDHFFQIPHNSTFFKFTDIHQEDDQPASRHA